MWPRSACECSAPKRTADAREFRVAWSEATMADLRCASSEVRGRDVWDREVVKRWGEAGASQSGVIIRPIGGSIVRRTENGRRH